MAVLEPSERNCARPPRGGLKLDGLAVLGLERLGVQHNLGRLWLGNRERRGKTARDTVRIDDVDEVIAGIIIGRFRDEQHGLGLANDWLAVLVPLVIEGPLPMDFRQKGHPLAKRPDLRLGLEDDVGRGLVVFLNQPGQTTTVFPKHGPGGNRWAKPDFSGVATECIQFVILGSNVHRAVGPDGGR